MAIGHTHSGYPEEQVNLSGKRIKIWNPWKPFGEAWRLINLPSLLCGSHQPCSGPLWPAKWAGNNESKNLYLLFGLKDSIEQGQASHLLWNHEVCRYTFPFHHLIRDSLNRGLGLWAVDSFTTLNGPRCAFNTLREAITPLAVNHWRATT